MSNRLIVGHRGGAHSLCMYQWVLDESRTPTSGSQEMPGQKSSVDAVFLLHRKFCEEPGVESTVVGSKKQEGQVDTHVELHGEIDRQSDRQTNKKADKKTD